MKLSQTIESMAGFAWMERECIYRRRIGMINYGFTKKLDIPYETVIELVRAALKKEGFGVLTEIDVQNKVKEKLGIDMNKYIILGACNPQHAYKAILIEENIGLMLPCNVIIYEKDGKTVLSFIRPMVAMQMVDNLQLQKVSEEVEGKLKNAFDAIKTRKLEYHGHSGSCSDNSCIKE
jgi:uncharacterized protein (DUF302 family)